MSPAERSNYTEQFVQMGEMKMDGIHTHLAALGRGATTACKSLEIRGLFQVDEGLL